MLEAWVKIYDVPTISYGENLSLCLDLPQSLEGIPQKSNF